MRQRALGASLLLVALVGLARAAEFRGGTVEPPHPAPEITLHTAEGAGFRLSRLRGNVVAIFFGYALCPDVCPTTLAELAQARKRLGEAGRRLRVVFITVDPDRDSPERLRAYVRAFDESFIGLTGSRRELARARRAFGVTAERRVVPGTSTAYFIDHSAFVYILDAEGRLRLMFPFGASVDDMVHDLHLMLGGK